MNNKYTAALVGYSLLLTACTQNPYRAQVEYVTPLDAPLASAQQPQVGRQTPPANTARPLVKHAQEIYIVQSGDTAYSIARQHNVPLETLRENNNLDQNYTIYPGDRITINRQHRKQQTLSNAAGVKRSRKWRAPLTNAIVVAEYNASSGDALSSKNGITLTAKQHSTVMAMANGVVVFAGNELRSYGNMVLVKHNNNIMSTYAHLDKITVTENQKIQQGEAIGTLSPNKPMLLQIRRNGKPINPKLYIDL